MENSLIVHSEHRSQSKVFKTKEEASTWFDNQKELYKTLNFEIYESTDDDDWAVPTFIQLPDGRWEAFIEASYVVYEEEAEAEDTE